MSVCQHDRGQPDITPSHDRNAPDFFLVFAGGLSSLEFIQLRILSRVIATPLSYRNNAPGCLPSDGIQLQESGFSLPWMEDKSSKTPRLKFRGNSLRQIVSTQPIPLMSDDPTKKHRDSFTVNLSDPSELGYFKGVVQKEFPKTSPDKIEETIHACARQIAPSESREKLLKCVREHLES